MPASSSLTIHLLELKLISDYFRNAGDSFVDHSANYYTTVDTPVRRELLRAAHANYARGSRDRPEPITGKDGRIDSNSSQLLWYLGSRTRVFHDRLEKQLPTPVSRAELEVTAEVLTWLSKNYSNEYPSNPGEESCYLPNTPEGRDLAEAVIRHKGGSKVEATVKKVRAAKTGPELFDTWVLAYLGDRYAKLATVAPEKGIGLTEQDLPLDLPTDSPTTMLDKSVNRAAPLIVETPGISRSWTKDCKRMLELEQHTGENVLSASYFAKTFALYGANKPFRDESAGLYVGSRITSLLEDWADGQYYQTQLASLNAQGFEDQRWMFLFSARYDSAVKIVTDRLTHGLRNMGLMLEAIWTAALGFVLFESERSERLARIMLLGYELHSLSNITRSPKEPCVCMLRILAEYLREPTLTLDKNYRPNPIYDTVFANWRNPNPDALKPILIAACDEHTWRVRGRLVAGSYEQNEFFRFGHAPIEILLIFRLRESLGLPNPVLDHPLMNTALGKLPQKAVPYAYDKAIAPVMARMRREGYDDTKVLEKLKEAGKRFGPRED